MVKVNDLSRSQYSANKDIRFKTSMSRSGLYDYSDAYVVVKAAITVDGYDDDQKGNKI